MFCTDFSNNNNGGLLVHFWIVFVVPKAKGQIFCADCVAAILRNSIHTSITNRTSVGSLQGLAVDMDSIVLSGWYFCVLFILFEGFLFLSAQHFYSGIYGNTNMHGNHKFMGIKISPFFLNMIMNVYGCYSK